MNIELEIIRDLEEILKERKKDNTINIQTLIGDLEESPKDYNYTKLDLQLFLTNLFNL